jgi:hypothetical protein
MEQNKGNQNRAGNKAPGRDENTADMQDQGASKGRGDTGNQEQNQDQIKGQAQNQRQGAGNQNPGNQGAGNRGGQEFDKNKGGQGGGQR